MKELLLLHDQPQSWIRAVLYLWWSIDACGKYVAVVVSHWRPPWLQLVELVVDDEPNRCEPAVEASSQNWDRVSLGLFRFGFRHLGWKLIEEEEEVTNLRIGGWRFCVGWMDQWDRSRLSEGFNLLHHQGDGDCETEPPITAVHLGVIHRNRIESFCCFHITDICTVGTHKYQ